MKNKVLLPLIASFILGALPVQALELTSSSAIVIDTDTGKTYYEYNADVPLAPASMTKIIVVYIIYEEIEKGNLSKDTLITADADDHAASIDPEATNVLLEEGVQYSIDELISAIIVPSACASAAMVGKYLSGSEAAFAERMTKKSEELGLNAYYEDASGLSNSNRITARSTAELVRLLINKYPDVLNYTSMTSIDFHGRKYNTTNWMLPGRAMPYDGVNGFKTGTTNLAGACFASSAARDGLRINSVTMHSNYGSSRYDDTIKLLDKGFYEARSQRDNLYISDIPVYINGYEVPSFKYKGGYDDELLVLAEDLEHYGFDIAWNGETRDLSLRFSKEKLLSPIDTYIYHEYDKNTPLLKIYNFGSSVTLSQNNTHYNFERIYDLNGYLAVSADELKLFADSYLWDNASKCLYIDF